MGPNTIYSTVEGIFQLTSLSALKVKRAPKQLEFYFLDMCKLKHGCSEQLNHFLKCNGLWGQHWLGTNWSRTAIQVPKPVHHAFCFTKWKWFWWACPPCTANEEWQGTKIIHLAAVDFISTVSSRDPMKWNICRLTIAWQPLGFLSQALFFPWRDHSVRSIWTIWYDVTT